MKPSNWETYLLGAHLFAASDSIAAERVYKQAWRLVIRKYGHKSAPAGMVLLDYAKFLDSLGRATQAEALQKQVQSILSDYLPQAWQIGRRSLEESYHQPPNSGSSSHDTSEA